MSPPFLSQLAALVPPEHLSLPGLDDWSPMRQALVRSVQGPLEIMSLLVLRGAELRVQDCKIVPQAFLLLIWRVALITEH